MSDLAISEQSELYDRVASWPDPCKYTVDQRIAAVTLYANYGNMQRVSDLTGIPRRSINNWRDVGPWWHDMLADIRHNKSDEMDSLQTKIIDRAHAETMDRLENGNETLNTKTGEIRRIKMTGRDTMMVAAIAYDKRQLNRMLPTSIKAAGVDIISQLAAQLVDLKRSQTEQKPAIEAERVDKTV